MSSTNLLLGSTGFLLLVALILSFGKMNQEKTENPGKTEALLREIARLEIEKETLENQRTQSPSSLIFTSSPYTPPPKVVESEGTAAKMEELQAQLDLLTEDNNNLRTEASLAAQAPSEEPIAPDFDEVSPVESSPVDDSRAERRGRLIRNALLQGTVEAWDPEYWTVAIDPAARANFAVGDELAIRRNDGILCTFRVTNQLGSQFVGDLKSNLATGAPEIVPGDELIIPPAFDGQIDY